MPQVKARALQLDLSNTDFDNIRVRVNARTSIRNGLRVQRVLTGDDPDNDGETIRWFISNVILEWDLEDENGPISPGDEDFDRMDQQFIATLMWSWWLQRAGISLPLGTPLQNGGTSQDSPRLRMGNPEVENSLGLGSLSKPT